MPVSNDQDNKSIDWDRYGEGVLFLKRCLDYVTASLAFWAYHKGGSCRIDPVGKALKFSLPPERMPYKAFDGLTERTSGSPEGGVFSWVLALFATGMDLPAEIVDVVARVLPQGTRELKYTFDPKAAKALSASWLSF
jgi:hypothetical protein